ncbi:interferon-induced protein 44 [Ictalurus furcatus]|uniref:interferon-induced protein 44 n=1 Tax=Ictalurus furcatus TaxID=66913 RepID=UPI0023504DEB|nr:interferon-induced protein 44 [Ictalurus furcatus]
MEEIRNSWGCVVIETQTHTPGAAAYRYSSTARAEATNYSNNTFEVTEASVMSWVRKAVKGLTSPSQSPAPGPNPEFDKPWREVTWSGEEKSQILRKLKDFQPSTAQVRELKILLHGPVGAGKSSFINSVNTVLQGYNTTGALAASSAGKSFTVEFKYHRLKKDKPGSFYPFVFTDIMGLEPEDSNGVQTEDIVKILQGHVKGGYTFNPLKVIDKDDRNYISNPGLKDKVHCLVSVLPADKISLISDDVIKKMRAVREKARELGIPQVVVMSQVDSVCRLVQEDLSKIYTSRKIKEKMKECSDRLGVPMNCIFPVQNYHEQVTNDLHMDILILMAMSDIIRFANDYVEDQVYNANEYAKNQLYNE